MRASRSARLRSLRSRRRCHRSRPQSGYAVRRLSVQSRTICSCCVLPRAMASCARRKLAWSCSCQSGMGGWLKATLAPAARSGIPNMEPPLPHSGHQLRRDPSEVVDRLDDLDARAVAGVERHLAVAEAPAARVLGAEPDHTPRLALHLAEHPGVRRVVVGAAVAD